MASLHEAKQSLDKLFKAVDVKKVVCVDDDYKRWDVDKFKGAYKALSIESLEKIGILRPISKRNLPDNVLDDTLEEFWSDTSARNRTKIIESIEKAGGEIAPDTVTGLSDMISAKNCELLELTPTEWKEQKDDLLATAKIDKTLFLFDRDLSNDNSCDKDSGIRFLQEAISAHDKTFCGILSNTFRPEEEFDRWKEFAKNHNIDLNRFVLISKDHLNTDADRLGFARMVKLAVLNSPCQKLAEAVGQTVVDSVGSAHGELNKLNIYEFEDIVFRKSLTEGIWEPDTLFRIFGLYQKNAVHQKLKTDSNIKEQVQLIRSVVGIKTHPESFSSKETSWKIQRLEWYENAEQLNSYRIPLGLGDVFLNTADDTKYILLCQPCDLMVRSKGQRGSGVTEVYLAQIINAREDAAGVFELKYFDENTGKSMFIKFGKKHAVYLNVLDLCAMTEDGLARYPITEADGELLIPSWQQRLEGLKPSFEKCLTSLASDNAILNNLIAAENKVVVAQREVESEARSVETPEEKKPSPVETLKLQMESTILPSSGERLFVGTYNGQTISYECQRIGRLLSPYADAALTAFHAFLARPAFSVDLGREETS